MNVLLETLKKHWGYTAFRPKQEAIIQSILQGNDTLALLPTGGGKSICYQLPGLIREGITLVISPLVALMEDQVQNLKNKGIRAVAITSVMRYRELDAELDNCVHGQYQFVYVSPERLQTDLFLTRAAKMKINLIAVDEAHCISEWGHDFRPSYRTINEFRNRFNHVPVLALTETATPRVVDDIQEQLAFKQQKVIQSSFERKNLAYIVQKEANKHARLLKLIRKLNGSGIVYCKTRRKTEETSRFINQQGISSSYYHAGLNYEERLATQKSWVQNTTQVICATSAFGMGIDKPDVRFVAHLDLPNTLEAYFQEAGRAGRDGHRAYGVLFFADHDVLNLKEKFSLLIPPVEEIRGIYKALGNFLQLAEGSGLDESFELDLAAFSKRYNKNPLLVYNTFKLLEKEGYLALTEHTFHPSRLQFQTNYHGVYDYKVKNPDQIPLIDLILRSYTGYFDRYVIINETLLANRLKRSRKAVVKALHYLKNTGLIDYIEQSNLPRITFTHEKVATSRLQLSKEHHTFQKQRVNEQMDAVIEYATNTMLCRSVQLLRYFGQRQFESCGQCDVCIAQRKAQRTEESIEAIAHEILNLVEIDGATIDWIIDKFKSSDEQFVLKAIAYLEDLGKIEVKQESICIKSP